MKNLDELDVYRRCTPAVLQAFGSYGDETCGVFDIPYPGAPSRLKCIASTGEGWDHVSVSLERRCPNWLEMDFIKRKFFDDAETVMQLHVPPPDHINCHPYCLHLWRPNDGREIPRPPAEFVA